jgi:hypothetical protein
MELINQLKGIFHKEPTSVYCQYCKRDITNEGGDVSDSKKIYCHGDKEDGTAGCAIMAIISEKQEEASFYNYYSPKEVQKAIKESKLVHFALKE